MTTFIENIYDEINLTMTREDKKIPLIQLVIKMSK